MTDSNPSDARRDPILRVVPAPADINSNGHIFGGWVLSQMDIAAGIVAAREAQGASWKRADWPPMPADENTAALTGEWPMASKVEATAAMKKIAAACSSRSPNWASPNWP